MVAALGKTDTGTQRGIGAGGGADLDARLRLMDRAEVDMQVLSVNPQMPHASDSRQAQAAARFVSDQYAELVSRHEIGSARSPRHPCRTSVSRSARWDGR
jgi:hypothetical protein